MIIDDETLYHLVGFSLMWLWNFLLDRLDRAGRELVKYFHSRYLQHQSLVRYALLSLLIFLFLGFAALTLFILFTPQFFYDIYISREIQEVRRPAYDFFMKAVSWFGEDYAIAITVPLISLFFLIGKYYRQAIFVLLTLYSDALVFIIKYLVNRPRPGEDVVHIIAKAEHSGFPSGHVVHYIVFFGYLMIAVFTIKEWFITAKIFIAVFCLGLISVVPFSRIYLGVHYLTDVIGGAILGIILLIILLYFFFRNKDNSGKGL